MGNLNYRTTKEDLVSLLSEAGEIVDAFLPTDRETGRPRGFGFITFASPEQAQACIDKFNGHELSGRRLNINAADERGRGGRGPGGGGGGRERRGGGGGGGRPSPIAEFKRGGRVRPDGGGGRGPGGGGRGPGGGGYGDRPFRPRMPPPEPPPGDFYDDGKDFSRDYEEDDGRGWDNKKKKKRKGSRRGLRAKKRSL